MKLRLNKSSEPFDRVDLLFLHLKAIANKCKF